MKLDLLTPLILWSESHGRAVPLTSNEFSEALVWWNLDHDEIIFLIFARINSPTDGLITMITRSISSRSHTRAVLLTTDNSQRHWCDEILIMMTLSFWSLSMLGSIHQWMSWKWWSLYCYDTADSCPLAGRMMLSTNLSLGCPLNLDVIDVMDFQEGI